MALLNEEIQTQLKKAFEGLEGPVKMVLFQREDASPDSQECAMCGDTLQLARELSDLDEKIQLETFDITKDAELAGRYKVDKVPALIILKEPDDHDYGIRLFGIPSGYEFATLIEDLIMVSRGKADLKEKTLQEISRLTEPVHIQVYTTPT